jgi:putative hydrolase of the HAD superfamily
VIEAIIFDLGGVVLESPLTAIAQYEEDNHIQIGTINRHVAAKGDSGAWARHERGEIGFSQFCDSFEAEMAGAGVVVDAATLLAQIEAFAVPRAAVLTEVERLRGAGLKIAALTNNWQGMRNESITPYFDVIVESSVEGVRKPDREIFVRCLARLGVKPAATLVIDDIGPNLKTARQLGMETFKATDEEALLQRLQQIAAGSDGSRRDL